MILENDLDPSVPIGQGVLTHRIRCRLIVCGCRGYAGGGLRVSDEG